MTLEKAKQLLRTNNIEFNILEFSSEAEYWRHSVLFPVTKNSEPCKVIAIIIKSNKQRGSFNFFRINRLYIGYGFYHIANIFAKI